MSVRGNNDFGSFSKSEDTFEYGNVKIFFTHGHMYNVKWNITDILRAAKERGAKVALYGHTHQARVDYIDDIYLINPGSVADSRITPCGYLALDITDAGIVPVLRKI